MKGIEIKLDGIENLKRDLKLYEKDKYDKLRNATNRSLLRIQTDAKRNIRVDTGDLRASIHQTQDGLDGEVFTNKKHAPYEEFGTGDHVSIPLGLESYAMQFKSTGKGGGSWDDLLRNIQAWCRRKGIEPEAAYPIARKIAAEGRPGQAFMFPAAEEERPKYINAVKEVMK
jgi:HK97 gp10 family phage protein